MRILDAVKTYDVSNVGYAKVYNADLLLATDPDCDRVGIAVKNKAGEYELLTGNQTGMLLDYNCSQRVKHGKMPADPVMVKTIVTMDMGVDGAYMICEMFSYYATKGISLLDELYKAYGYCLNNLNNYEFDGSAGFAKMQNIMQAFRGAIKVFGDKKVVKLLDYAPGLDGLSKSDVLKSLLEDNGSLVVRSSDTESKLKNYISVSAENKEAAEKVETRQKSLKRQKNGLINTATE